MSAFSAVLKRDLRLARRAGAGASLGLMFFLVLIAIVPFAIGADQKLISRLAPALLWIAALLATLLGLDGFSRPMRKTARLTSSCCPAVRSRCWCWRRPSRTGSSRACP